MRSTNIRKLQKRSKELAKVLELTGWTKRNPLMGLDEPDIEVEDSEVQNLSEDMIYEVLYHKVQKWWVIKTHRGHWYKHDERKPY